MRPSYPGQYCLQLAAPPPDEKEETWFAFEPGVPLAPQMRGEAAEVETTTVVDVLVTSVVEVSVDVGTVTVLGNFSDN